MQTFKYALLIVLSWVTCAEARLPYAPLTAPGRTLPKENIVYQGSEALEKSPTWKSVVQVQFVDTAGQATACTAGVLGPRVILTAAHCIKDQNIEYIIVNLFRGSHIADQKFYTREDYFSRRNPSYAYSDYETIHDTGLIVLKEPLFESTSEYKPLAVINKNIRAKINRGSKVYVAGAGATQLEERVLMNSKLYYTTGTITSFESDSAFEVEVTRPSGICGGDSGSPIVVTVGGEFFIAGVSSAVTPNLSSICGTTLHGTLISASQSSWINATVLEGLKSF